MACGVSAALGSSARMRRTASCTSVLRMTLQWQTIIVERSRDEAPRLRASGRPVAIWPDLQEEPNLDRLARLCREALRDGARRIAVYGVGRHTRRSARLFELDLPIVGLLDDHPPPGGRAFGLPVVPLREWRDLEPDTILLSSDAWEAQMWENTAPQRASGVRVIAVYGEYEHASGAQPV